MKYHAADHDAPPSHFKLTLCQPALLLQMVNTNQEATGATFSVFELTRHSALSKCSTDWATDMAAYFYVEVLIYKCLTTNRHNSETLLWWTIVYHSMDMGAFEIIIQFRLNMKSNVCVARSGWNMNPPFMLTNCCKQTITSRKFPVIIQKMMGKMWSNAWN